MEMRMRTFLPLLTVALLSTVASAADAQQSQQHVPPPGMSNAPMQMPIMGEMKGVTSWNTLAKVKQIRVKNHILPEFSKEVVALGDKEIRVQGFMMPLEPGEKQKHFLISLNPQTCAFCLPAGPEGVVEVLSKTPVKYTFEPIVVSGKLTILKDDPMGLYYRMDGATQVAEK
jgi:hypothetical protein